MRTRRNMPKISRSSSISRRKRVGLKISRTRSQATSTVARKTVRAIMPMRA
jgi:hypothetical protein